MSIQFRRITEILMQTSTPKSESTVITLHGCVDIFRLKLQPCVLYTTRVTHGSIICSNTTTVLSAIPSGLSESFPSTVSQLSCPSDYRSAMPRKSWMIEQYPNNVSNRPHHLSSPPSSLISSPSILTRCTGGLPACCISFLTKATGGMYCSFS